MALLITYSHDILEMHVAALKGSAGTDGSLSASDLF